MKRKNIRLFPSSRREAGHAAVVSLVADEECVWRGRGGVEGEGGTGLSPGIRRSLCRLESRQEVGRLGSVGRGGGEWENFLENCAVYGAAAGVPA